MASVAHLANFITTRRSYYAKQMASDLARLRVEYGNQLVDEALQLSRQADLRASLSVSGQRQRQHERRQSEREAQELFRKRGQSDGRC